MTSENLPFAFVFTCSAFSVQLEREYEQLLSSEVDMKQKKT